jgi:hypothetical protein
VRGVENGLLAYVGKKPDGGYSSFEWQTSITANDIEISDDMFIIQREVAEAYQAGKATPVPSPASTPAIMSGPSAPTSTPASTDVGGGTLATSKITWTGEIPAQKWMNFYTKVLSKFASGMGLKLTLKVEVTSDAGIPTQKMEETKVALQELGLTDEVSSETFQKDNRQP